MTYTIHTLNSRRNSPAAAAPGGIKRFLREISLIVGLVGLVFWAAALLSYSQRDAAWSTSGNPDAMSGTQVLALNWGGHLGAWVADASYFLFGFSVWWGVAAVVQVWLAGLACQWHGELPTQNESRRASRVRFWLSLALLLLVSAALEWSRLYRFELLLPGHAGGVIGYLLGGLGVRWLGFSGSGLVFIVLGVMAVAGVFNFSWASVAIALGARIDHLITSLREKRELAQDQALGKKAAQERESILIDERLETEQHPPVPVIIKPAATDLFFKRASKILEKPLDKLAEKAVEKTDAKAAEKTDAKAPQLPAPPSGLVSGPAVTMAMATPEPSDNARLPLLSLLDTASVRHEGVALETLEMTSRLIEKKLKDFGVEVRVVAAAPGPVITRYEIEPATGVKGAQVVTLAKDLARALSLVSIRVIETIPGKNYMALELPNARRQPIKLSEILGSQAYNDATSLLTIGLGKDIAGHAVVADLAKMPHCLVAGTTGSGKSVGINAMILSLLYKADAKDVRLLLIDPKMLEMSVYEGIPHLLAPVVTDMKQAAHGLNWCVA
ncbi:MAG: DNA translocase FtsK 4TM domain-containing protein, partial [Polaromonas sp.]|nr:DNA translocase FtsK 4TM domain-containing protein [Polaromonas sp.]